MNQFKAYINHITIFTNIIILSLDNSVWTDSLNNKDYSIDRCKIMFCDA